MPKNKHLGSSFDEHMLKDYEANAKECARLTEENTRLKEQMHTCHADCARAGCVNGRLRAALEKIMQAGTCAQGNTTEATIAYEALV